MKRRSTQSKRRRERKSGLSPYARQGKTEVRYSAAYYAWKGQFVSLNARHEAALREHTAQEKRAKL
jgi:hypothetical protein